MTCGLMRTAVVDSRTVLTASAMAGMLVIAHSWVHAWWMAGWRREPSQAPGEPPSKVGPALSAPSLLRHPVRHPPVSTRNPNGERPMPNGRPTACPCPPTPRIRLNDLDPADQQQALAAAHEAGHAVACEVLGRPYFRVTLGDSGGPPRVEAAGLPLSATTVEIEREVMCALAGLLAETLIFKDQAAITTVVGGVADCVAVRRVLGQRARDRQLVDRLLALAVQLVSGNLVAIKRVAKALVAKHELTPVGVREAIGGLTLVRIAATGPDSVAHVP